MQAFIERLLEQCKRDSAFLGLLLRPEPHVAELVCSDRQHEACIRALPALLEACGPLAGLLVEGDLYTVLPDSPPHTVLLRLLPLSRFAGVAQGQLLWEWNGSLTSARPLRDEASEIGSVLQRTERGFWVLLHRAASRARAGEALEAAEDLAALRRLLVELLSAVNGRREGGSTYRAGNYAAQLKNTLSSGETEQLLDALEAARQVYFSLRYEYASAEFVRCEQAELLATALLAP